MAFGGDEIRCYTLQSSSKRWIRCEKRILSRMCPQLFLFTGDGVVEWSATSSAAVLGLPNKSIAVLKAFVVHFMCILFVLWLEGLESGGWGWGGGHIAL